MRLLGRGIPLRRFLLVIVTPLIVVPPLVAAGTWAVIAERQEADVARRIEAAKRFVRAGADRRDDREWQAALTALLADLRLDGTLYEVDALGKRPVYVDPDADLRQVRLEQVAPTEDGALAAAFVAEPPDRTARLAWALVSGLGTLAAGLVVVFWLFDRWLIMPLRRFSEAVDRVAGGDAPERPPRSRVREIDNVSDALIGMSAALRDAAQQEANRDRERRFLVSALAHDLRTPLFALRGYLQALQHGLDKNGNSLSRAEAKAAQLDRLIEDLFAFTRLEYLHERAEPEAASLGQLLRESTAAFEPLADDRQITLHVDGDGTVDVLADRRHLERVAANLLDNAVTHTPNGGTLSVNWGREGGTAWFTIADSGSGIPDSALPHVFEPLYRADNGRRGTGLGLTIAQRLLEANGGRLTAENDPAGGARLTATLPAIIRPSIVSSTIERSDQAPTRVLNDPYDSSGS